MPEVRLNGCSNYLSRRGRRAGQPIEICARYEAGYDEFRIYRALTARGAACAVLDSASIQESQSGKKGEDRQTDAESLCTMAASSSAPGRMADPLSRLSRP